MTATRNLRNQAFVETVEKPPFGGRNTAPTWAVTETEYLKQLKAYHRARARAALRWRTRFLKALATSLTWTGALSAARVSYNTVRLRERNDPEFAAQVQEAEEYGAQLLHDVCWKEAVEGHLEPVYFQEELVGHIRNYDTRIQIEMLRAHMHEKFKTAATANVQINNSQKSHVLTEERRMQLIGKRRRALEAMPGPIEAAPALL